jgi:hypothetical protein
MGDHTRHGKWSQPGVPHKGWSCVHFEDLGEPSQICEMCESAEVRFVHYMEHPEFSGTLAVGCVCAENMEDDYLAPRAREKTLRHKARRRKSWAARKWRISAKGNSYLNTDGFNIIVFGRGNGGSRYWSFKVENRANGRGQFSRRRYLTQETAKNATLDALVWAKENTFNSLTGLWRVQLRRTGLYSPAFGPLRRCSPSPEDPASGIPGLGPVGLRSLAHIIMCPSPGAVDPAPRLRRRYAGAPAAALLFRSRGWRMASAALLLMRHFLQA